MKDKRYLFTCTHFNQQNRKLRLCTVVWFIRLKARLRKLTRISLKRRCI